MSLTSMDDRTLTSIALRQWANYIETGSVTLCAEDLKNMGKEAPRPLDEHQRALVTRLRALAGRAMQNGIK